MEMGYAGRTLFVDLSRETLQTEPTSKWSAWIAGRGLGAYLLAQDPALSNSNPARQPIVVAPGLLVGSEIPMATRTAVAARSQVSGGYVYSNVGGDFGSRMKSAGFDAVVVSGASQSRVILVLESGEARLMPVGELWGLKTSAFQAMLREKINSRCVSFIGIGPSGEKQARIACLMVDRAHAAGWGGSGAVFGAKNLKAIVAVGDTRLPVYDPGALHVKAQQLGWRIRASEAMAGLVRGGTHGMAGAGGVTGLVPTAVKNLQDEYLPPESATAISETAFTEWETRRSGCIGCAVRCLHLYEMRSGGFAGVEIEGMHANSVRGLGSNLGVSGREQLLMAHSLCNEYGLDVDGVAAAVGFALECADNGILERDQPGGVHLAWGDGDSIVKLIEQIGERQGLGETLSEGVCEAAKRIGKGSERYAMTTKQVGINEQGLRSHRAWALGVMTATRGGGHLGGSPQTENRRISPDVGERLFGVRLAGDPGAYEGKGKLTAWTEGLKCIVDSLGLCYFAYGWYDFSLGNPEELAELYRLATGAPMAGEELHRWGLRMHTLERYLSFKLAGYQREDDWLPDRFFDIPVSGGAYQGEHLDRELTARMLDEYYQALGWDVDSGLPTRTGLQAMG
ncbi:MAG: aldehyde ferredoxin oxidoreductase C-terminal domain-containing protein, partial [Anaerolineaceae bacterium]|nr:aldehyde ferredoxin oxidoreductase C-terminal domain-containing protein [Anaerolineaceae bacterium]